MNAIIEERMVDYVAHCRACKQRNSTAIVRQIDNGFPSAAAQLQECNDWLDYELERYETKLGWR